jgi:hypothetical protein
MAELLELLEVLSTGSFEFVKKFEDPQHGYRVELIELWIEAKLETWGVTRLFISLQGGGGCKVVLRPKQ